MNIQENSKLKNIAKKLQRKIKPCVSFILNYINTFGNFKKHFVTISKKRNLLLISGAFIGVSFSFLITPPVGGMTVSDNRQIFTENSTYVEGYNYESDEEFQPEAHHQNNIIKEDETTNAFTELLNSGDTHILENIKLKIKSGDTIDRILVKNGVSKKEAYIASKTLAKVFDPRKLKPKQAVTISLFSNPFDEKDKGLESITIEPKAGIRYSARRDENREFAPFEEKDEIIKKTEQKDCIIEGNLLLSANQAGIPRSVVHEVVDAYSHTIDFQKEIRNGDSFSVYYEKKVTQSGKIVDSGTALYAKLTLRGEEFPIYKYENTKGYSDFYDSNGKSVRKSISRYPVPGARISSPFGYRRHPILGYRILHKGVDFAARRGTPIKAGGDGVITKRKYNGGYGKYIKIRHNSNYSTAYAHMKGFARGIYVGKRVRQGQIIGYVGNTGRSTGPHLHYEIIKNGRQVNPLKVRVAAGKKLKGKDLQRFAKVKENLIKEYKLASSNNKTKSLKLASKK